MKNGICPKCDGTCIHSGASIRFKTGPYSSNTIPLGGMLGPTVPLDNYVCVDCGYVESYVGRPDHLTRIQERWPRVERQPDDL